MTVRSPISKSLPGPRSGKTQIADSRRPNIRCLLAQKKLGPSAGEHTGTPTAQPRPTRKLSRLTEVQALP
ncbi:hypothetical protein MVEN_00028300 [Mycena venus]|uniref:Uncharacterized protein n=1 Tax=Mycena venus TaxID=2733690 RepID=A0A8H6Z337_9AGAR|nr:hypothetical protein MVEN_00028300 [Mycena venus]